MKIIRSLFVCALSVLLAVTLARADDAPKEQSFQAPHEMKIGVKMIGPVTQATDLQMV